MRVFVYVCKEDRALNHEQKLICYKAQPNQPKISIYLKSEYNNVWIKFYMYLYKINKNEPKMLKVTNFSRFETLL